MRLVVDKVINNMLQVGICLLTLCGIIVVNTNTVSYAKNQEPVVYIVEEKSAKAEKIEIFNWEKIGDKVYCTNENGEQYKGIAYVDKGFRYFLEDGSLYTGWVTLANKTFYFDPVQLGLMLTGEQIIDGMKYQFLPTGELMTGWYDTEKGRFYKNQFGYDESGLVSINGKTYFIDENTGLKVGTYELDHTYYTDTTGAVLKGDYTIGGKTSHYSQNGEYLYGWLKDDISFTFRDADGVNYVSGKFNIDGSDYQFDETGHVIVNQVIGMYKADNTGKLSRMPITVENLDAALDEILATTGNDIVKIGEYVRTHHAYKYRDKMATREEMAVFALNNRYISCYYYEALTGLLLEKAGYEVITIAGKGFVYAEHYWSLVKTTRNGIEGYYHVDSLKSKYIKTDAEMVANGFKWPHENYPATP